jgi:hypothetical protein
VRDLGKIFPRKMILDLRDFGKIAERQKRRSEGLKKTCEGAEPRSEALGKKLENVERRVCD